MDRWFFIYDELRRKLGSRDEYVIDDEDTAQLFANIAGELKGKRDLELIKHLERALEFMRLYIEHHAFNGSGVFLLGMEAALELLLYAARRRGG